MWVDPVSPEHAGTTEGVALISQSGGLALTMMSPERRLKLTHVVSCGNQLDFGVAEAIRFLAAQDGVSVVAMLIEGLPDIAGFREAARLARDRGVCLAVLKIGKSQASARATIAHTGTLSGSRALYRALFRQEDIIEVGDIDELVSVCQLVTNPKRPTGRRLVAMADSGGACGLIADAAVEAGLEVDELPPESSEQLRNLLPSYANLGNPLDVTASLWGRRNGFREVSRAMADAGRGDVLVCAIGSAPTEDAGISEQWGAMVDGYGDTARSLDVPVVGLVTVGAMQGSVFDRIAEAGLVPISGLRSGLSAVGQVAGFFASTAREADRKGAVRERSPGSARRRRAGLGVIGNSQEHHTEGEAKRLLAIYGVPTPPGGTAASATAALEIARSVGYPVVAKLEVRGIHHKTDLGGVKTDIRSGRELRTVVGRLLALGREVTGDRSAACVRIERHVRTECEVLVAGRRDDDFGAVLSVAAGGIYTEALADVTERLLPVGTFDISEMLDELRLGRVLSGYRGQDGLNRKGLIGMIAGVAALVAELPEVRELEVNPVAFDAVERQWYALDALLVSNGSS